MKKNKIITIILSIIIFFVPLAHIPRSIGNYSLKYYSFLPKAIILFTCGLFLLILFLIKLKDKKFKFDISDKLILLFGCLNGISTIFSYNIQKSVFGWNNRYTGLLSTIIFITIYYCTKYYFQYSKSFFKWLFRIASLICIYSFIQYFDIMPLHKLFNIEYIYKFAGSTIGNTNFFGSFITLFLPASILLFLYTSEKKYLAYSTIFFGAMICSNARSSWFAFFIYFLFICIYIIHKKNKDYFKNFLLLLISFTIIFLVLLTQNIVLRNKIKSILNDFTEISSIDTSNPNKSIPGKKDCITEYNDPLNVNIKLGSGRLYIWTLALIALTHHPLIGAGPSCSYYAYLEFIPEGLNYFRHIMKGTPLDVHNEFLDIAVNIGIPGLIIYLLFLIKIFYSNTKLIKNKINFIIIITLLGYLIQAFFNICVISVAPVFWFLLGLSENYNVQKQISKDYKLNN